MAVLVVAAGIGAYAGSRTVRRHLDPPPSPVPTPSAVARATASPAAPTSLPSTGAVAAPAAVAAALDPALGVPSLGGHVLADVVDISSGTALFERTPSVSAAPASTAKLLTAAAVLAARGADYRIVTTLAADPSGTVYLVGGGDPTLSAATGATAPPYSGAARLQTLAAAARAAHLRVTRVAVDDSPFRGPATSPFWAAGDVPSSYAAPITAVMADGGRDTPSAVERSAAPDLAAGRALAAQLGVPGAPVVRAVTPPSARVVGTVSSAPVRDLVEEMLENSDNVIAECLARQVAIARKAEPSFTGSAAAVRVELAAQGVDVGTGMVDGSGLASTDRLSAAALVHVLQAITSPEHPDLHPVVTALPVAGWSGTLADRYLGGSAYGGAGVVRAKTGTLTGVSSLAGLVHDRDGRLLAFALIADQVPPGAPGTASAEAALDRAAAALAGCGCR